VRPLRNYVAVELGEARIERLYAGTVARVGARKRRTRALVAASVACAFLLIFVGWRALHRTPPIAATSLPAAGLVLHDGSRVDFDAAAQLQVKEDGAHITRLVLAAGSARFDVTHDPARTFTVDAGDYSVVDAGTIFTVAHDGDHVRVSVERGEVRVSSRSGALAADLHAGQSWESTAPAPNAPVVAVSDLPLVPAPPVVDRSAILEFQRVSTADGPARAYESLGHERFVVAVSTANAKELFELADGANLSGHPQDAALAYDALRRRFRSDSRAGIAAFQLGRIRQDKLGDPGGAEEALRDAIMLALDPSMREDAESRRVAALETLGDANACRKARDEYLQRQPSGVHAKVVATRCGGN